MLIPSNTIEHLGLFFNTNNMTVSLTKDKCGNLIKLCKEIRNQTNITIRQVAKVLGTIVSYIPGVELGMLHYRHLEQCKVTALKIAKGNYDAPIMLTKEAKADIDWWIENVKYQTSYLLRAHPKVFLETDSSKQMWGAVRDSTKTGGCWNSEEQTEHINLLEMKAVLLGFQALCSDCRDVHIRIRSDSQTCVAYVNKMGGSKSEKCNDMARRIWQWCIDRHIYVSAEHIPGVLNKTADEESRNRNNSGEWSISQDIFELIVIHFKVTPSIDLFASRINFKVPKFVAWVPDPMASFINVFFHKFPEEVFYAFPPFLCIDKFLKKVDLENMEGIIIVPCWKTQPFFPSLLKLLIDFPILIRWRASLLEHPNLQEHPLGKRLKLMASRISGNHVKSKDFRQKLWISCVPDGLKAPLNNMPLILKNGKISVGPGKGIPLRVV